MRVSRFCERPERAGSGVVSAGVYLFRRALADDLEPCCSLEAEVLPVLADRGRLLGLPFDGYFVDIGVPDSFSRAQHEVPAQRRRAAVFFDRDGELNHDYGHVGSRDRFRWMEGAKLAVKLLNDSRRFVFLVTNKAGGATRILARD